MKRALLAAFAVSVAALVACSSSEPPAGDVCAEAKVRFESCGTSLPLLGDGPCAGSPRIVARCVVDRAHDCDELATLFSRIDACVADMLDGGDTLLPPATDLPVTGRDAGASDGGQGAPPAPTRDGGTTPVVDAAPDAPVTVLAATGAVAMAEAKHFQTPSLPAGSYRFDLTGTGDADLYVRKTTAPTSATYDCRSNAVGTTESCTVKLDVPAVVHVMIRGEATTSTFTLEGRHE